MYTEIRKLILESDHFTLAELYEAVENKGLMERFEDGRRDTRITTRALNDLYDEGLIKYEKVWSKGEYDYRYRPYGSGCKWNKINEYTCKSSNHSGLTLRVSDGTKMIYCPCCGDTIEWI